MASPPSGAESNAAKLAKDRNCPFCGQAFTSSSLGRHLDLYIKKNPKPPDGVHDVDEIRKLRGNITRRQSRVASIKRDTSVPAGPASARYSFDDKAATTPDSLRRVNWQVNRPGWEATGVINDLPPRLEPRPAERRDSSRRDQLKADLDQRQKLADELDTGRAAQLALKEILDTVRNAEASATGKHLFDGFDFFQQSFPALCLRLLSPTPSLDSSQPIVTHNSWSPHTPWDRQRDAMSRIVEERGQWLQRKDSLLSSSSEEAQAPSLNLDKFHQHINHVYELWKNLPESTRQDIWQREIVRSYIKMETELKEAKATIAALKRDSEMRSRTIGRDSVVLSPAQTAFMNPVPSLTLSPTSMTLPDEVLRDLPRQGLSLREWDYERLLHRWKNVVRDGRRSSTGLSAQRNFSTSSGRAIGTSANLAVNGAAAESTVSRSASVTSAMSAAGATRTSSMDSAAGDADAEGEEEDMDADSVAPDAHAYTRKAHDHNLTPQRVGPGEQMHMLQTTTPQARSTPTPTPLQPQVPAQKAHVDQHYKWPQPVEQPTAEPGTIRRMPPGPDSWNAEFHHAISHNMEGLEGPATTGAPASVS